MARIRGVKWQINQNLTIINIIIIVKQEFYSTKRHPKKIIIERKTLEVGIKKINRKELSKITRPLCIINSLSDIDRLCYFDYG